MAQKGKTMRLTVRGSTLTAESTEFTAVFEGATLVSVVDRRSGAEFMRKNAKLFPVEMYYLDKTTLGGDVGAGVSVKLLTDYAARIILEGNDSDRELFIRLDPGTGDLCVRPSGQSARRGVLAVRWNVPFASEVTFVLPLQGGRTVRSDSEVWLRDRNPWPSEWNAQLVIAERDGASLMIHSEDRRFKYKALVPHREDGLVTLGFDSETVGPVEQNRTAGGVEWRLNTYAGDWKAPADRYRAWMEKVYDLAAKREHRPAWVDEVTMAVCWVGNDPALLEPLAKLNPPSKTLIHQDQWRRDKYDINYPDYTASTAGRAFIEKAMAMGFRVMPHFNYFACYNGHPFYERVRDWQVRDIHKNQPKGWYTAETRMSYIHAGLGLWRRKLVDNVVEACRETGVSGAFLDQTYHAWNTNNGIVENLTMLEGVHQLQEEMAWVAPGLVLGGENLTEISFQREAFAQLHIHGWGNLQPAHVRTAHPICSYLWKGHSRYIGYIEVEPTNPRLNIAIDVYRHSGVIPTFIARDDVAKKTELIHPDTPAMKMILKWVKEGIRYDL